MNFRTKSWISLSIVYLGFWDESKQMRQRFFFQTIYNMIKFGDVLTPQDSLVYTWVNKISCPVDIFSKSKIYLKKMEFFLLKTFQFLLKHDYESVWDSFFDFRNTRSQDLEFLTFPISDPRHSQSLSSVLKIWVEVCVIFR